jgi:penicillin-binding protein 1C
MAMEAGIITPKTKLPDIPMDFGLYSPENFDKTFSGWVSAEDALAKSLNVPAVFLLNKLSKDDFYTRLIRMHFAKLSKNKSDIGLSAILGACGVSLEELNGLYRCIANGGVYSKAHFLKIQQTKKFDTIFNPMANEMVSRMLTKLQRPDYPFAYQYSKDLPEIAWKTGTSYGRKDAWSVGFTAKYTVAVWAGNFDNKGAAGLTGASIATPLLFDIFRILEKSNPSGKLPVKDLPEREVCSVTGLPAGKHCPKSLDFYIPFISTNEICNHIRETYISIDGKYEYCYDCLPDKNYKKVIMEYYPPEIAEFFKKNQLPHPEQLPHNPKCTRLVAANKPTITSPLENQEYLAEKGKFKLELAAVISSDASNMNWYADGKFIGSCNVGEKLFYTPEISGSQKITCTDNLGRSTSIFIKITFF